MSGKEREWLLLKKADGYAGETEPIERFPESVLSGLTVEELRAGPKRVETLRTRLVELRAPRAEIAPRGELLMLATLVDEVPSDPAWLFEIKYDGVRVLASRADDHVELRGRSGQVVTSRYPEVTAALRALPLPRFLLDGEIVALDDEGRSSFQRLQERMGLTSPADIERAEAEVPVSVVFFDALGLDGHDVRGVPLEARKECLKLLLPARGVASYGDHVGGHGAEFLAAACERRLEGVVAKRRASPYVAKRSKDWLKIKCQLRQEFVIGGYTTPQGTRAHFGALHLGLYENGELVYVSKVGTGFDDRTLELVSEKLRPLARATSPFARGTPGGRGHHWVEPRLVGEIRFSEWTRDGGIRHPAFLGLRDDKRPEDCVREAPAVARGGEAGVEGPAGVPGPRGARALPDGGWAPSGRVGSDATSRERVPATPTGPSTPASPPRGRAGGRTRASRSSSSTAPDPAGRDERHVVITNPKKVFWPDEGYTKSDLIDYYDSVSPWLLPYLRDRPLVLTRYPDGIKGKSFFQKDAPGWIPSWIRTARIYSDDVGRDIDYFIVDDRESLRYVVNLGTIPLHLWSSRLPSLDHPDWLVLDLDPKGAPFTDVVKVARALHGLLDELALPSYVKTSGATGLHILLPLGARYDYEVTRTFARLLAVMGVEAEPAISTIARPLRSRGGKVYIDFGQNGRGQTIVAPFSVRPLPGPPVSCPLRWEEVTAKLDPARFTIRTAPARFEKLGDPLAPVLSGRIDVAVALRKLERRVAPDR